MRLAPHRDLPPVRCHRCGAPCRPRPNERPSRFRERSFCCAACRNRAMRERPIRAGYRQPPRRPPLVALDRARLLRLLDSLPEAEAELVRRWHGLPAPEPAPGGLRASPKGLAMTKFAANNADATTALRARRDRIQPAGGNGHWGDWCYMTDDDFAEVTKPGYFANCGQVLTRGDRIAVTCRTDALARGDRLGPNTHGELAVSRCECMPGGQWDIRTVVLYVVRETPADAPALDHEGRPLSMAQPAAAA